MKHATTCVRLMLAALVCVVITAGPAVAEKNTLAIFNLRPANIDAMGYGGDILFSLISALEQEKQVEVMPRRQMEAVLDQEGLVQGSDPEQVIAAGRALGIKFILYGEVSKEGAAITSDLFLMDVQSGLIVHSWKESFSGREAIGQRVSGFASELSAAIHDQVMVAEHPVAEAAAAAPVALGIDTIKARGQGSEIVVAWSYDESQPISGFHVYRSSNDQGGPYQFMGGTQESRFVDTNVRTGLTYYYRVGVLIASGAESKSSVTAKLRFSGERMPHAPLIMGGAGHVRRASIQFVPSLQNEQERFKIVQYKVYRRTTKTGEWQEVFAVEASRQSQSQLAFEIEDPNPLKDGSTYHYAISSLDNKQEESDLSDAVTVTTVPAPVLELEKDGLLRQVKIHWQPVEHISGYYVYRSPDGLAWEKIGTNRGAQKTAYLDKRNLADGRDYHYQITVYDEKGESSPSNIILAKIKDLPEHPDALEAKNHMVKSVLLSWQPVDDPDVGGYYVYRGLDAERLDRITTLRGYEKKGYLDKGSGFQYLADGTEYYYAVESYNLHKAQGGISSTTKATTKPRPARTKGLRAQAGADHIVVAWESNPEPDIAHYVIYRRKDQGGWSRYHQAEGTQTVFEDRELKPGVVYQYRVVVQDKDRLESDPADSEPVKSPLAPPPKG